MDMLKLTNHKANGGVMIMSDGMGNTIKIRPNETKDVRGDFDYFHDKMKTLTGFSVKKVGTISESRQYIRNDLVKAIVTNHRAISFVAMAIGNGRSVKLASGESKEVIGREAIIKQNHGISCKVLKRFDVLSGRDGESEHPDRIKAELGLPVSKEGFVEYASSLKVYDLRAIAARVNFKARSKQALIDGLLEHLYDKE